MTIEVGQRFRLRQHIGYNPGYAVEEQQIAHAPLFEGQIGTVVGISPIGERGAGRADLETIVLAFEHHQLGDHRDHAASSAAGRHVGLDDPPHDPTGITRHWSCTAAQLEAWFEEVTGDTAVVDAIWQPSSSSAPEAT